MKYKLPLFAFLMFLTLQTLGQYFSPLSPNEIENIKKLIKKEDYSSLSIVLKSKNFTLSKSNFNYDNGRQYIFCELNFTKESGNFQCPDFGEPYSTTDQLSIEYIDFGDYKSFNLTYIFHSTQPYSLASYLQIWQQLPWTVVKTSSSEFGIDEGTINNKAPSTIQPALLLDLPKSDSYHYSYRGITGLRERQYSISQRDGIFHTLNCKFPKGITEYTLILEENYPEIQSASHIEEVSIPMIREGGSYYIMVEVAGKRRKYLLDTGASEISIDDEVYELLLESKSITSKDNLPNREFRLADGSLKFYKRALIPRMAIGPINLENIPTYIVKKGEPLLLGKTFLDSFSSWKIDNVKFELILTVK